MPAHSPATGSARSSSSLGGCGGKVADVQVGSTAVVGTVGEQHVQPRARPRRRMPQAEGNAPPFAARRAQTQHEVIAIYADSARLAHYQAARQELRLRVALPERLQE